MEIIRMKLNYVLLLIHTHTSPNGHAALNQAVRNEFRRTDSNNLKGLFIMRTGVYMSDDMIGNCARSFVTYQQFLL